MVTVLPGWADVGLTVSVVVAVTLKLPVPEVVAVKFGSVASTV
jgi:hypothetical protein